MRENAIGAGGTGRDPASGGRPALGPSPDHARSPVASARSRRRPGSVTTRAQDRACADPDGRVADPDGRVADPNESEGGAFP